MDSDIEDIALTAAERVEVLRFLQFTEGRTGEASRYVDYSAQAASAEEAEANIHLAMDMLHIARVYRRSGKPDIVISFAPWFDPAETFQKFPPANDPLRSHGGTLPVITIGNDVALPIHWPTLTREAVRAIRGKSDKDKFVEMLTGWGVTFETLTKAEYDYPDRMDDGDILILVTAKDVHAPSGGVVGWNGFFTEFVFDAGGKFRFIGIWE